MGKPKTGAGLLGVLGLAFWESWVSMSTCMHSETAGSQVEALPCNACKRQARFLTPYGLKCPTHALETAIYDEQRSEQGWLPIRIRPRPPNLEVDN